MKRSKSSFSCCSKRLYLEVYVHIGIHHHAELILAQVWSTKAPIIARPYVGHVPRVGQIVTYFVLLPRDVRFISLSSPFHHHNVGRNEMQKPTETASSL